MSVTLSIENYPTVNIKERSSLAADVLPATTSLTLINNNNIVANDYILIGRKGSETAEIRTVATASGANVITSDAITLHHDAYEDVTALIGNQIKIYRAPNVNGTAPADSAFVAYGSPISIDPDQLSTIYTDATGDSTYWYKTTYFNSTSSTETAIAKAVAVRGGGIGDYATISDVRSAAGYQNNLNITDTYIASYRSSAQDYINSALAGIYVIPFTTPVNSFIQQLTKQLAAGYMQVDQHGSFTTAQTTNGQSKIDWVEAQLKLIRGGDLTLTDAAGNPLPSTGDSGGVPGGGMGMSGYPNQDDQGGGFKFQSDMRY